MKAACINGKRNQCLHFKMRDCFSKRTEYDVCEMIVIHSSPFFLGGKLTFEEKRARQSIIVDCCRWITLEPWKYLFRILSGKRR